ncbi:MAG: hypothetical protein JO002_04665 [Burkholderiaceae bacterium]|nr:hypothetical protein [Burkholderiaceae bacterium]
MLKFALKWRDARQARQALSAMLKTRHSLRLHSFLLFAWTIFAGTLVSHLLLSLGMATLAERYALACAAGYGAFLFGMRVWLWHIEALPEDHESAIDAGDVPDVIELGLDGVEMAGNAVEGVGEGAAAAVGEGGVAVLALVGLALAATVLVLLLGPEMLIDVAFEAILAGSLIGAMRLGHEPDWFLRVLAKTWWVFLLAALLMVGLGNYAHRHYPYATTLSEVLVQMATHRK